MDGFWILFYNPYIITLTLDEAKSDPCQPDPCGPGALASVASNTGLCSCSCPPGLQGDPYVTGCRPECLINADCPRDKACSSNTCTDPCPGTCGTAATCSVINHVPTCVCDKGYVGNAFEECVKRKHDIYRRFSGTNSLEFCLMRSISICYLLSIVKLCLHEEPLS